MQLPYPPCSPINLRRRTWRFVRGQRIPMGIHFRVALERGEANAEGTANSDSVEPRRDVGIDDLLSQFRGVGTHVRALPSGSKPPQTTANRRKRPPVATLVQVPHQNRVSPETAALRHPSSQAAPAGDERSSHR